MKKINPTLLKNFISLIVIKGFDFIVPLITLPYLVSHIGLDNYGLVNLAISLTVYFSTVIQFGFTVTATKDIAKYREDKNAVERIYSLSLKSSLLLTLLSFVVYLAIVFYVDKFHEYLFVYLLAFVAMAFRANYPIWVFQGYEKMKYITYLNILSRAIFVVGMFFFIKNKEDYIYMPALQAAGSLFCFVISIFLVYFEFGLKIKKCSLSSILRHIHSGRHVFISQFAPNLYSNSSTFLLGLFSSHAVVGIFTAASKVIDVFGSFAYVIANTFLPYLSRNMKGHDTFKKIMLASGGALTLGMIATADIIVAILFKNTDDNIAHYIRLLSPSVFLIFFQLTYGTNYLILIGKDKIVKNIVLFVSISSLIYSVPVIYFFDINGSIFNLVFTRIVIVTLFVIFYKKYKTHRFLDETI